MRRAASLLVTQGAQALEGTLFSSSCRAGLGPSTSQPSLPAGLRYLQGFARIAEHEKGQTKFHGYYAGGFYINNVQVPGSVIAQQDMYLLWKPRTMAEVTPASLAFLDLIKPAPEILVVGCGLTAQPLPPDVAKHLKERGIKAEVLDSRNATGYFNVLNEEGRVVVGALLAADPSAPLAEVMPEQQQPLTDRDWLLK